MLDVFEFDETQHVDDARANILVAAIGVLAQRVADVLFDGHRIEQRPGLEQHADLLSRFDEFFFAELLNLDAVDEDLPVVRPVQPDRVVQQDGLAASRTAQHDDGLAAADRQIDAAQDEVVAEALLHAGVADEVVAHHNTRRNILVRKKSEMITEIEDTTTVLVVALPTPSAPPRALIPL